MAYYDGISESAALNFLAGTTDFGDAAALRAIASLVNAMTGGGSPEGVVTAAVGALYVDETTPGLYQKTSGSGNTGWTAVGGAAGLDGSTTADTVLLGVDAGASISSGTNNVFMGVSAGYAPNGTTANAFTTGSNNVCIGYQTGLSSSTQRDKTVSIGYTARAGGTYSIGIGSEAVSSAQGSIALGRAATASNNNTAALGYATTASGYYSTAVGGGASATADGSVAIGADSGGASASSSVANEIALGTANHTLKTLGGRRVAYVAKTTTYTIAKKDYLIECTSGTFTVTLPTAVSDTGRQFIIKNSGAGTITIDGNGTETIDGAATVALAQYESKTVVSNGANWIVV